MKKSYLLIFLFLTVILSGCVYATNVTSNDVDVSVSNNHAKMGDTVTFTATKSSMDTQPVVFKVNNKTVKNNKNESKVKPVNLKSSIRYTIPDGFRSGEVLVTAVTNIGSQRKEANTYFNVDKMNTRFTNVTIYRSLDSYNVNSVILDDNNHTMYGSAKVAIKINGKTLQKDKQIQYFKATNGVLNATFKLPSSFQQRNIKLTLVTGDTYAYIGTRHVIQNLVDGSTEIERMKITFTNTNITRQGTKVNIYTQLVDNNNYQVKDTSKVAIKVNGNTLKVNNKQKIFYAVNGVLNISFNINSDLKNKNVNFTIVTGNTYSYVGARKTIQSIVEETQSDEKIASVFVKLYSTVTKNHVQQWLKSGITDVYVQAHAATDETDNLRYVIGLCKNTNLRVHAWIRVFNEDGTWVYTQARQTKIKNFVAKVIKINGVKGIVLDYVRYSGTNTKIVNVNMITNFVKEVNSVIKSYDKNIKLSACVFPEMAGTATYYGQSYSAMSEHLDYILPMAYKYSYNEGTSWLKKVTKYVADRSKKAKVVTILQTYKDENGNKLIGVNELTSDIKAVMSAGSYGYSLFYIKTIKEYPKIF